MIGIKELDSLYIKQLNVKTIMKGSMSYINYDVIWGKLSTFAIKAGRVTTRPVLLLFFVMKSKDTPKADKLLVLSALSYLVFPIDILDAKRLPVIGWFDEIASISVAYQKVCRHITPEMEIKVDAILDKWFPKFTPYQLNVD